MIDLEKRAKAWDEFMDEPRDLTIGDTFNTAYELGVRDGAASVDRKAIAREAFEKVIERLEGVGVSGDALERVNEATDAVLADMEKGK